MTRFLRQPPSVQTAAAVIITATAVVVVVGGIAMRVLDHREYSNIWVGMWWALQTVTTVGYGDVTPSRWSGRIVAALVMLEGIAFLTVTIAAVTSTFVARAEADRDAAAAAEEDADDARLEARLEGLDERLERVEGMLRTLTDGRRS
jgi:voltage-gated potassium channel